MLNRTSFAIALLAVASMCCSAQADEWMTDLEKAKQIAREKNCPILVHFWATWCPPCMKMEHTVLHTKPVQQAMAKHVVGVLIEVDKHQDLVERFGIEKFPSDVFIEPDTGKHIIKSEGQKTEKDYADAIARAAARYDAVLAARTPKKPTPDAPVGTPQVPVLTHAADPMLLGYCPVTLQSSRRWEKGVPQFSAQFRGQTYQMATEEALKNFQQDPVRYAPQFLGCDPVVVAKNDRAVPGSTRYAAFYDDELYLFSTDETRKEFKSEPDRFIREKVVLDLDQIETVTK
jgi:thiol-disulfide isomerase/thioredoxin